MDCSCQALVHGDSPGKNTGVSCHALDVDVKRQHCTADLFMFPFRLSFIHSLLAARALRRRAPALVAAVGRASRAGSSSWGAQPLAPRGRTGSRVTARTWAPERGLGGGAWAELLHSMWDLPGLVIKLVCPELAGRFLSTVPRGKS